MKTIYLTPYNAACEVVCVHFGGSVATVRLDPAGGRAKPAPRPSVTCELDGVLVLLDRAEDGVLVVQIMTEDAAPKDHNADGSPRLRVHVHVNDCMVHREDGVCDEQLP